MSELPEGMDQFYDVLTVWNNMVPPNAMNRRGIVLVTLEKGWQFIFLAEGDDFAIQPVDPSGRRRPILTLRKNEEDKFDKILRLLKI